MPDLLHLDRYLPMIRDLAEKALDMAVDASPTKPREGEFVRSLMVAVPAARSLLGHDRFSSGAALNELLQAANQKEPRFVDGCGHTRLVYHYLAFDLVLRAAKNDPRQSARIPDWLEPPKSDDQIHHEALERLCGNRIEPWFITWNEVPFSIGPMLALAAADTPDAWVYREMVLLHSDFSLFTINGANPLLDACRGAVLYHLHHTQPDYTTYQPWALAAFLYFPETVPFGEQQLHDVATHLSVEGPPGALVPGLLLADAWATLNDLRQSA